MGQQEKTPQDEERTGTGRYRITDRLKRKEEKSGNSKNQVNRIGEVNCTVKIGESPWGSGQFTEKTHSKRSYQQDWFE